MFYFAKENRDQPCLHKIKQRPRLTTEQYNFSSLHSKEPRRSILCDHIRI